MHIHITCSSHKTFIWSKLCLISVSALRDVKYHTHTIWLYIIIYTYIWLALCQKSYTHNMILYNHVFLYIIIYTYIWLCVCTSQWETQTHTLLGADRSHERDLSAPGSMCAWCALHTPQTPAWPATRPTPRRTYIYTHIHTYIRRIPMRGLSRLYVWGMRMRKCQKRPTIWQKRHIKRTKETYKCTSIPEVHRQTLTPVTLITKQKKKTCCALTESRACDSPPARGNASVHRKHKLFTTWKFYPLSLSSCSRTCSFVCVCVCVFMCMCLCVCVCVCVCMRTCVYTLLLLQDMQLWERECVCVCMTQFKCIIRSRSTACRQSRKQLQVHTHAHTHTRTHTYTHGSNAPLGHAAKRASGPPPCLQCGPSRALRQWAMQGMLAAAGLRYAYA